MTTTFVPFWIVLEFLDSAQYDPFIECRILKQYNNTMVIDQSPQEVPVFDLEIKDGLIAQAIPVAYTIERQNLKDWAQKIADWILKFPEELDQKGT